MVLSDASFWYCYSDEKVDDGFFGCPTDLRARGVFLLPNVCQGTSDTSVWEPRPGNNKIKCRKSDADAVPITDKVRVLELF